jgi:hypothetical protein
MSETDIPQDDGKKTDINPLPRFVPGTIVTSRSLVVDGEGTAWWICPDGMTCSKVS